MKHAVIVAHPSGTSFTLAAAEACAEAVRALGHEAVIRDLYGMGFDPLLRAEEIPRPGGFAPAPDVAEERILLADAEVFILVYPLWFYLPPAILVGYVDRIFGMGFGYGPRRSGGNEPLLSGRRLLSLTSSGAPAEWVAGEGAFDALERVFERHLAGVCGLRSLGRIHTGSMGPSCARSFAERRLQELKALVTERLTFGPPRPGPDAPGAAPTP